MYLKSIEIHGFKSFANKIVFEFPEGITGIVGPNGSGKSNVADAVRWVLGEQKIKQLRGSKMEDVIFAGTSARRPQSYAYVAITLDNSDHKLKLDFDEVTISRRVYRSGESEFMINGSVCRLRDVQELFYDTGIGKEGYSIIGQGQIDKILQGKPEERREIFDEAVGIVKYKKRKILALRKLDSERQNLARVSDILSELKRQVGPLKRQSEAAEQFVVYKNELRNYDINLFLCENGDIRSKIKDYQSKEDITSHQLQETRQEFEQIRLDYEKVSVLLDELDQEINTLKTSIARCNIVKENLNGQKNVLNEQIRAAREARASFVERTEALKQQIEEAGQEEQRLLADKEGNQSELTRIIRESGAKDSQVLDIQAQGEELREQIESLKEQLIDLVNSKGTIHARMERLDAMMEQMRRRREELTENLEQYSSDKADREKKMQELKKEQEDARNGLADTEGQFQSQNNTLKQTELQIRSLEAEISNAKSKVLRDQASLESLRNITERYEGYGNTIREIMKLKDQNSGIHGVVADIIRTEKQYETAIETALGGSIQNVVTDTENTAKNIIEYLKKNKLGRATFLPLKAISGRGEFGNPGVLDEEGVIGLASTLVQVDEKYKGVASYLLGRIVVIDTIDHALKVARKYHFSLIIVTLEGELLNRGGSLTGGAYRNKSNLLGRRREMEELEQAISRGKTAEIKLREEADKLRKQTEELHAELEILRNAIQEHKLYLNTVSINLQAAIDRTQEIEGQFQSVNQEQQNIEAETQSMQTETSTLQEQLEANRDASESMKARIAQLEQEAEDLREQEARESLAAQTFKVEISRLNEQSSFLNDSVTRVRGEINRLNSELETLVSNHDSSSGIEEKKQKEIEEIDHVLEQADAESAAQGAKLISLEKDREEKTGFHRDFIRKREEFAQRIADLDKEQYRLASQREKLEERFENKSSYMWDEYQLTYNQALSLRDENLTNVREMREKIAQIKSAIRSLGSINVSAIEEYKEVKERFEFLSKQHEDLTKAEADLVKIIRGLDREMRKQFQQEFKKICTEFSKVFREMFGGGTGTIELEEDMDILEAGITIIAQPPGKKLQNMMQLSGGEKALTAIALLFAIQNLKPSPFCILDEIEAALDDSNIIRYAGYLHKLTKDTQFIVITHRKGTMEAADRLYGITMQERGVSTLISVNLADIEDEPPASA